MAWASKPLDPVPGYFEDEAVRLVLANYRLLWALDHASSLMAWDTETNMPRMGSPHRGLASAELATLRRRLLLDEKFVELVERAASREGLNDYERGVVRVLQREIRIARSIPEEIVWEMARIRPEALAAWREAREKGDYSRFKPYLERIVELNRSIAEHLGYEGHPYNALLDLYEEGLTVDVMDRVFDSILPHSRAVLEKTRSRGFYPEKHPLEDVEYDRAAMEEVNRRVLSLLGYPWERARLDVSAHPFTIAISIDDVRITTRYEGRDFRRTLMAVVHEFGHALYELQVDKNLAATPLQGGVSSGVHESQSRFWENIIGRSPEFARAIKPILDEKLGYTRSHDWLDIYRYLTIVRPDYIRVEADELTYNFHIYIRYTIEKQFIAGELGVDDARELWNSLMEEYLGIRPRSDREGILQDIHWAMGSMGYFPTYTLGNVIAAQVRGRILSEIPDLYERVEELDFKPIREALARLIHRWGSTYPPQELVERATGEPVNPEHFNRYIEWKYLELPEKLQ
ncbi:MAG: carboxypeptidase M32 [Desulfurococcales archaeon]|nr:carboxypeptidase M32 [Desulfurococcales archaeon]